MKDALVEMMFLCVRHGQKSIVGTLAWQRRVVHFYRTVFSHGPAPKAREAVRMLKAVHASEDRTTARRKAGR